MRVGTHFLPECVSEDEKSNIFGIRNGRMLLPFKSPVAPRTRMRDKVRLMRCVYLVSS